MQIPLMHVVDVRDNADQNITGNELPQISTLIGLNITQSSLVFLLADEVKALM